MEGQEIQTIIVLVNNLIKDALPKTWAIMFDLEKVLQECEWNESLVEGLFIFNRNIFPNQSCEAKIIWSEILDNIITHMDNMLLTPMKWTVENRFWLNSKFVCTHLGLTNFKDRKTKVNEDTLVSLRNCMMTESETFADEAKIRRAFERKLKEENSIIFGKLPTPKEMRYSAENPTNAVLDAVHNLAGIPSDSVEPLLEGVVANVETIISAQRNGDAFLEGNELMCPKHISNILQECLNRNQSDRVNIIRNVELSNKEWKLLIDQAAAGDTIDSKNVLVAWQAVKNNPKGKFKYHIENPPGTRATCNHTDWQRGKRMVCSRYINSDEEFCALHKTLGETYKENRKTMSLFPVYFGDFVFYTQPAYDKSKMDLYPMTFGIGRKLMTKEFEKAKGKC